MGALCGEAPESAAMRSLDAYALAIGLAFQVVDDILDVTADSATLGKTAGKDAQHDKPTYVSMIGLDASQLGRDAHDALDTFGPRAVSLRELANLVVNRVH
jgi:farnesyl diphosphate synthase